MKYKAHATVKSHPDFKVHVKPDPIAFKAGAEGSMKLCVGPINARVGEIPFNLTIPFLPGGAVQKVASIGAFGVRIGPFDVAVEGFGVRFDGVLGTEGMNCDLTGSMACRMELDLTGTMPCKLARASFELADRDHVEALEE